MKSSLHLTTEDRADDDPETKRLSNLVSTALREQESGRQGRRGRGGAGVLEAGGGKDGSPTGHADEGNALDVGTVLLSDTSAFCAKLWL